MNFQHKSLALFTLFVLFIASGSAFSWGGGGFGGGGSIGDTVGDFADSVGDSVQEGVQEATDRESMQEYGRITGNAVQEGSEFLGEAGETMYREATDEQAQAFYKDASEIAGEMGQTAYKQATDEQAQQFYNSVLDDAQQIGNEGYEAATSEQAKQFYNDAIEGTRYAGTEAYSELTDEEAKKFYRAAVKQARETGAESWEELSDEEAQKIYSEAFAAVQDVGKTVKATATSDDAKYFVRSSAVFMAETAEVSGDRAKQFVQDVSGISDYESLVDAAEVSKRQAKWVYDRAYEHSKELGEEMTDEEAREYYSQVMADMKHAAELSKVFGESFYSAATDGEELEFDTGVSDDVYLMAMDSIRNKYVSGEITLDEVKKSSSMMKKALDSADDRIDAMDSGQTEEFYSEVISRAKKGAESVSGEQVYEDAMEKVVFGKKIASEFEGESSEFFRDGVKSLETRYIEGSVDQAKVKEAVNVLKDSIKSEGEYLSLSDEEKQHFYEFAVEKAREGSTDMENTYSRAMDYVDWQQLDSELTSSINMEKARQVHERIASEDWTSASDVPQEVVPEEFSSEKQQKFREYLSVASDFRTKEGDYSGEFEPQDLSEVYGNAYRYAEGEESLPGGSGLTGAFTRGTSGILSIF